MKEDALTCAACGGRGWEKPEADGTWPEPCGGCGGRGVFTLAALARGLAPRRNERKERRALHYALRRLAEDKSVRGKTARRVLFAMAAAGLLGPEAKKKARRA